MQDNSEYFFSLTPEKILTAVESSGLRCTGRCLTLNSMENRVYEVEIEIEDPDSIRSPSDRFRIVKFYRPGRWSEQQILEEHKFLNDLLSQDIPVVAPFPFSDGRTLHKQSETNIMYCIFPKKGGRMPDEFDDEQAMRMGRLMARVHNIGSASEAPHRIKISPQTYGRENLDFLLESNTIPLTIKDRYSSVVNDLCSLSEPLFENVKFIRIHGDCHLGNILWGNQGPFLVDFDDMVRGPAVQDIWLMIREHGEAGIRLLNLILEGYESMRAFDRSTLRLIEPLRALRMIHFSAWIARRWKDPAFPLAFSHFGSDRYWIEQVADLEEQRMRINQGGIL